MDEKYEKSDYVYLGRILTSRLQKSGQVHSTLEPLEIFKGSPKKFELISDSGTPTFCRRLVFTGFNYIVYGKNGAVPKFFSCPYTVHSTSSDDWELQSLRKRSGATGLPLKTNAKYVDKARPPGKCTGPISDPEKFAQSDYVYHGVIVESVMAEDGSVNSRLRVLERFKSAPDVPALLSDSGGFNRDNLFAVTGVRYLVFGNKGSPAKFSICSPTRPLHEVSDSLRGYFNGLATDPQGGKGGAQHGNPLDR